MDSLDTILGELSGDGWQITHQDTHTVRLSKPYPDVKAVQSWNTGVIVASAIAGCAAYQLPPSGALALGLISVGGIVWGITSRSAWRDPMQVIRITRGTDGKWIEHAPVLEKGD